MARDGGHHHSHHRRFVRLSARRAGHPVRIESWPFLISAIWIAGFTAGGCLTFVPSMTFVLLHLSLMELPVLAVGLWIGNTKGNAFAITVVFFVVFLVAQCRQLHAAYWQGLLDRAPEQDRRRELKAASRAKSQFLANMSHEIRTPMNGILGMTELALSTELNDEQREFLTMARSSAEGLLVIINDILDFSKIEAGRIILDPTPFDLTEIVADSTKILSLAARKKGLQLNFHIEPDVPRALIGDSTRLRQVLLNLTGNALKFTAEGKSRSM
jgi:signal transduction histidine kinase